MKVPKEDAQASEAETFLLSACMLDGQDVISKAVDAGISPESFSLAANQEIFRSLLFLFYGDKPTDPAVVADNLLQRGSLERVGGFEYVTTVSSKLPTTIQAAYFIDTVREKSTQRTLRLKAMGIIEALDKGNSSADVLNQFEAELSSVRNQVTTAQLKSLADFDLPPEDGPDEILGANRYISRGDSCLIVSSSGMGKSSMQMIWAAHIALGRSFLGIETKRPETSLIIQAEDSPGDIGELWYSIRHTMKLNDEEMAVVRKRVIVVRDKVNRGAKFIAFMRSLIAKVKPALVWLNPLHAYAGCDIANAQEMGEFLREGLNKANRDEAYAYMIIHHTPKPMTGKGVVDKKWHELMYDAAGSAELVNWARAVITLRPSDVKGDFNLILAKRGMRAGVRIAVESAATTFLEITDKIPIRQSSKTIPVPGRSRPFHLLDWTIRDADVVPEKSSGAPSNKYANGATFRNQWDDGEVLSYFPSSKEPGGPIGEISKAIMLETMMAKSSVMRFRERLINDNLVAKIDGKYRRTLKADAIAEQYLQRTRQPSELPPEPEQLDFNNP